MAHAASRSSAKLIEFLAPIRASVHILFVTLWGSLQAAMSTQDWRVGGVAGR